MLRVFLFGLTMVGMVLAGESGHFVTAAKSKAGKNVPTPPPAFQIKGRNTTATIRALTAINGVSIALLEERMRPGKVVGYGKLSDGSYFGRSDEGFLGADESLIAILAEDNDYVLGQLRQTHQAMAKPMIDLIKLYHDTAKKRDFKPLETVYPAGSGNRFRVSMYCTKGVQDSPFGDSSREIGGSCIVTFDNLTNGKSLTTADMVPHLIDRYGFYEGKGTSYRLAPAKVAEVFSFLNP